MGISNVDGFERPREQIGDALSLDEAFPIRAALEPQNQVSRRDDVVCPE